VSINVGSVEVSVVPDAREFGTKLSQIARNASVMVKIDADTAAAQAKIDQLSASNTATIVADVDDAAARAKLDELTRARSATVNVDVDTGGGEARLAALGSSAATAGGGMSSLTAAALTVSPALIPIGAAAVAGLGVIGPLAIAGAGGLGVLALGFSGVSDAVKNLGKQHDAVAAQAAKSAGSQAASTAAIAAAEASLSNTRANAAASAVRAAESVTKAKQAQETTERQVSSSIASAETTASQNVQVALGRQEQAEKSLTAAQKSQRQAQQDLTQARKDAQQQIEDLSNSLTDNNLSQRQAVLDVADAQANLNKVLADPAATAAQRTQAQLTYDQQIQRQKELAQRGERLATQQADATRKGVEGSDLVASAQQRVDDANQKVIDSTTALGVAAAAVDKARADGAAAVAKAQQDGAAKIAAAQQSVSDAVRAQTEQQRQSAFAISQAQAAVTSAMQSTGAVSDATLAKINADLAATGAATLTFAMFVREQLAPAFQGLKEAASSGLLPGVQAGIEALLPMLPGFTGFIHDLAVTFGDLFAEAGQALTAPFWGNFFSTIGQISGGVLTDFVHILENIGKGFAGIILAFVPMSLQVGGGLVGLTEKFATWGASLSGSSGFKTFVAYVQEQWPKVRDTIENVATIVQKLLDGGSGLGGFFLTALRDISGVIAALPTWAIEALVDAFIAWRIATTAAAIAQWALNVAMDANPVGALILLIEALVFAIGLAAFWIVTHWDTVQNAFMTAFHWLQDNWPLLLVILTGPIGLAVLAIVTHWDTIKSGISSVFDWVRDNWPLLLAILTGPIGLAVLAIASHWDSLKEKFKDPVNFLIQYVMNDGIIKAINWVTHWVGIPAIPNIPMIGGGGAPSTTAGTPEKRTGAAVGFMGPVQNRATGGSILGPGTGTSDSVPVWGSNGEFMVNAEATAKNYGLLVAINGGDPGKGIKGGLPAFAGGGLLSGLGDFFSDVAGWITDPIGHLKSVASSHMGGLGTTPFAGLLGDAANGMIGIAGDKIKQLLGFGGGSSSGAAAAAAAPGGAVERWRATVLQVLSMLGQPAAMANGVLSLIKSESGGNPNAINLTDSNAKAGHPSQGLMQTIPTTFLANAGPFASRGITDPLANIYAGVHYALGRYGPAMLMAGGRHSGGSYIGYDEGGLLPPGPSLVYNGLGHDEIIAPKATFEQVMSGASGGSARTVNGQVFNGQVIITDTDAMMAKANRQAQMAAARFS
jgi:SLT domain-containing protein